MQSSSKSSQHKLAVKTLFARPSIKFALFAVALTPFTLSVSQGYLHDLEQTQTPEQHSYLPSDPNTLTVVAVQNSTTVFQKDGFTHGFGYDLARDYADDAGKKLNVVTVKDEQTALKWVNKGKAQFAMTTATLPTIEHANLIAVQASCGATSTLQKYGLNQNFAWVFKSAEDPLAMNASGYLCQTKQTGKMQQLASFYNPNYVNARDLDVISRDLQKRLPIYKASFKRSAQQMDLDWQFLAAIGYQESYLDPKSVSPTGVRGVMMLTNSTAKQMGVSDRTNPAQSIEGGAKYFNLMLEQYADVPYPDRNWFALVAYNMGPGAVDQIRQHLKRQGKDPNQWINLYQYLQNHQRANSRHTQAIQYVKRIRIYLEHIKTAQFT